MVIKKAEFVRSIKSGDEYFNENIPEIAVAGKSNVGKSSLINMLTDNGKLARVSKQPGKTRLINYFLLNGEFYLVDLPGYGFARVSKTEKDSWETMMQEYFAASKNLRCLMILVDIRHKPGEDDAAMVRFAEQYSIPYMLCATKADKIAKSKRKNEAVRLKAQIPKSYDCDVFPVSSEDGWGKDAILAELESFLKGAED